MTHANLSSCENTPTRGASADNNHRTATRPDEIRTHVLARGRGYARTRARGTHTGEPYLTDELGKRRLRPRALEAALPDHEDRPSGANELVYVTLVAGAVTRELLLPELDVALGRARRTEGAAMPEAAIHEDGDALARIGHVGLAGSGLQWSL